MRANNGEPGPGPSSAPKLSLLPSNVLTVFLARFHVRHGNQIDYQYPPSPHQNSSKNALIDLEDNGTQRADGYGAHSGIDLTGVEWKVLPSGGHLIDEDIIYFQTTHEASIGVACFRKVELQGEDGAAQRGARMVSAGLILQCEGSVDPHPSGLAQQLAIVPHISNLKKLADELVHDPEDVRPLKEYYDTHHARCTPAGVGLDGKRMKQLRMRRRRDPRNLPHDPISHMPALCGSLGALLPHLLKKLMLPRHRLLIFSPAPPLVHAAHLGYNLADLVALAIGRSGRRHENLHTFARHGLVEVRGQIGVHDIPDLEQEQQQRGTKHHDMLPKRSWIAWSTDKILLEKPHLFDSVLDLSPLIARESRGVLDEAFMESSPTGARLLTAVRAPATGSHSGGRGDKLKHESWTTREFAIFNELDAQAQRNAERAERLGAAACISRRRSRSKLLRTGSYRSEEAVDRSRDVEYTRGETDAVTQWRGGCARSPRRSGAGTLSAVLAFLRYWLAGWWFLPRHWRYGLPAAYVLPLGIRGDGGVRASILVMPEDESDEDEDLDGDEDREIAAEDEAEEERRSALAAEPADMAAEASGQPSRVAELAAGDHQTSTNSSSDTEELDLRRSHAHHLVPPDPLLAAVGASPVRGPGVAESDRLSMSHASLRRRSTDRSAYARSTGGSEGLQELGAWYDDEQDRFHSILSDSLWMVWSHWTSALVSGLLDILEDRLAQIEQEDDVSLSEEGDVSELLISRVAAGLEVTLGPADMASLGLSAGNALDVRLVESLGSTCLQLLTSSLCDGVCETRVTVDRGWSLFRWLL